MRKAFVVAAVLADICAMAAGVDAGQRPQPPPPPAPVGGKADIVQVVGCLSDGPKDTWVLTNATEPVVSKVPFTSADALKEEATKALGAHRFALLGTVPFSPAPHKGHKMAVKGLLIKDPGGDRLNVTSLEMLAAICK